MTDEERKRVTKVISKLEKNISSAQRREIFASDLVGRKEAELDEKLYELIKESILALFDGRVPLEQAK